MTFRVPSHFKCCGLKCFNLHTAKSIPILFRQGSLGIRLAPNAKTTSAHPDKKKNATGTRAHNDVLEEEQDFHLSTTKRVRRLHIPCFEKAPWPTVSCHTLPIRDSRTRARSSRATIVPPSFVHTAYLLARRTRTDIV